MIHLLVFPAAGIAGQWNALCLDFNIWSVGDSIRDAVEMVQDAVLTCLEDCDPAAFEPAEPEHWARAHAIIERAKEGRGFADDLLGVERRRGELELGVITFATLQRDATGRWHLGPPQEPRPEGGFDGVPAAA